MKKLIAITLAALLALSLAACGATDNPANTRPTDKPASGGSLKPADDGYIFVAGASEQNVNIVMGADPAPVLAALGEPAHEDETPSCATDAHDITYFYQGFELTVTYPDNEDPDYITSLRLVDDTYATQEGIYIGAQSADIKALYGEPDKEEGGHCFYRKGLCELDISVGVDKDTGETLVDQIIYDYKFLEA